MIQSSLLYIHHDTDYIPGEVYLIERGLLFTGQLCRAESRMNSLAVLSLRVFQLPLLSLERDTPVTDFSPTMRG